MYLRYRPNKKLERLANEWLGTEGKSNPIHRSKPSKELKRKLKSARINYFKDLQTLKDIFRNASPKP